MNIKVNGGAKLARIQDAVGRLPDCPKPDPNRGPGGGVPGGVGGVARPRKKVGNPPLCRPGGVGRGGSKWGLKRRHLVLYKLAGFCTDAWTRRSPSRVLVPGPGNRVFKGNPKKGRFWGAGRKPPILPPLGVILTTLTTFQVPVHPRTIWVSANGQMC